MILHEQCPELNCNSTKNVKILIQGDRPYKLPVTTSIIGDRNRVFSFHEMVFQLTSLIVARSCCEFPTLGEPRNYCHISNQACSYTNDCKSQSAIGSNSCLLSSSNHNRCLSIFAQQQLATGINTKILPQHKTLAHQALANNQRSNPANFFHHISRNQIT